MRKWLLLLLLLAGAAAVGAKTYRPAEVPHVQRLDRNRYTSNPDGILSPECVARIDSLCRTLRTQGLAQVAVVAVDDIAGDDVFAFAIELFRSWGVGDARNNNGLGLLLVRERREIRFVTGGGLEGVLPDAICKRIQTQFMLPAFRSGDYDAGMTAGMAAVATVLEQGAEALPEEEGDEVPVGQLLLIIAGVFGIPAVLAYLVCRQQYRCPNCGKAKLERVSSVVVANRLTYREVLHTFRCKACGYELERRGREHRNDNDSMLGGGFFGGLGGGSFGGSRGGGFGGGTFGGGGAGSRW